MKRRSLIKRICCLTLALMTAFSTATLFGCVKDEVENNETTIQINYWNAGFGIAWINNLIEKFETAYPEYDVYLEQTANQNYFDTTIEFENDTTIDLYITGAISSNYSQYLEPLDDIYEYKHDGESKTIGEKMVPSIAQALKGQDGKSYALSYGGGLLSIAYDKAVIDGVNHEVPRTTDELISLVAELEAKYKGEKKPFITFEAGGYWRYVYKTWLVQYNGMDYYYNDLLKLEDAEGKPNKAMLLDEEKETGRYQLLKVLEKLFKADYVTADSAAGKFSPQQTKFLSGNAVMMPNGTWLYNEMKKTPGFNANNAQFAFMKMPVISAIIDNLSDVEDDTELSELIKAVDAAGADITAVPTEIAGKYSVSQETVNRVYEARNIIASNLDEGSCMIPKYSNAKDAAKTFLKFMYKDQMIKEYCDIVHMLFPANLSEGEIDTSDWSMWDKSVYEIQTTCSYLPQNQAMSRVLSAAGLFAESNATMQPYSRFSDQANPWTADKYWEQMTKIYNENWDSYLAIAGIK